MCSKTDTTVKIVLIHKIELGFFHLQDLPVYTCNLINDETNT